VLSFPPEAPIATFSPGWKRFAEVTVSATSSSKMAMKQGAQMRAWFFGRRICARLVWQISHSRGAMVNETREGIWENYFAFIKVVRVKVSNEDMSKNVSPISQPKWLID
jgi:hypothetical protein